MLTDLRVINKIIQPMGPLQPDIPWPFLLPKEWPIIVIDLKDFFIIPVHECDKEKFAFSVPTLNRSCPLKRYHWKFLPQGMLNSLTAIGHDSQTIFPIHYLSSHG